MSYLDWSYIRGVPEQRLRERFGSEFEPKQGDQLDRLVLAGDADYVYFGYHTHVAGAERAMERIVAKEGGSCLTMRWQDGDSWQLTAASGVEGANFVSRPDCYDLRYSKSDATSAIKHLVKFWGADRRAIAPFFKRHWRRSQKGRSDGVYDLALVLSLKRPWEIECEGEPAFSG